MLVVDAERYCKENEILIKGKLRFDPYVGWLDESEDYQNGYCQLCDLNIKDGLCLDDCGDDEPCKM